MSIPGSTSSLAEWLAWLDTLVPDRVNLGLERVTEVLQRLQLPLASRVIHVAGTNGKGSTVMMLEALLRRGGRSVGSYTSPHVRRYNERVRIAGREIADPMLVRALGRVLKACEDVPLTYFEFGTLAALCAFDEAGLDYLVLEIGLGGRLDAVNAVEPDAGIITNVALDHCDWLGADVESIAREKAGILRADKPFVYADPAPAAAVIERAAKLRTDLRLPGRDYRFAVTADGNWRFSGRRRELPRLAPPSLAGAFQLQNAAGVLALIEALGEDALLDGDLIDEAWAALVLPGRLQVIQRRRRWILDVAHNPAAACAVAGALPSLGRGRRVTCLIGILDDKDVAGIFEPLSEFVDEWVAVTPQSGRAIAAHELARQIANLSGKPCEIAASIEQACRSLEAGDPSAADVLVIGSFMTVGPVLAWLERQAAVRTD